MGSVFTSPIPAFAAGQPVFATDLAILSSHATASTDPWGTWSPTLTNLTVGSGTLNSKYRQIGKNADLELLFTLGVGSAVGTGPLFTLPFTLSADYVTNMPLPWTALLLDSGTTQRQAFCYVVSSTQVGLIAWNAGAPQTITSTAPWTWAAPDQIVVRGSCRTA